MDTLDYESLYLEDHPEDMPDLESSQDFNTLVYDRLGDTLASTTVSADTEVTNNMFGLSMGMPETQASARFIGTI